MKKLWAFVQGVGECAFFALPYHDQHYPYGFAAEALTNDWEAVGKALKDAIQIEEENHE